MIFHYIISKSASPLDSGYNHYLLSLFNHSPAPILLTLPKHGSLFQVLRHFAQDELFRQLRRSYRMTPLGSRNTAFILGTGSGSDLYPLHQFSHLDFAHDRSFCDLGGDFLSRLASCFLCIYGRRSHEAGYGIRVVIVSQFRIYNHLLASF